MRQHYMLLMFVCVNLCSGALLHLNARRRGLSPARRGDVLMYFTVMSIFGGIAALYMMCRFVIFFLFAWSDEQ